MVIIATLVWSACVVSIFLTGASFGGYRERKRMPPSATCRYCQKDHDKMQHEELLKEYPK